MSGLRRRAGLGRPTILLIAFAVTAGCATQTNPSGPPGSQAPVAITPSPGGGSTPAHSSAAPESQIDLSTLGGRIAFSAGPPHAEDIYIVNAAGDDLLRVTTDPAADFDPTWSPGGSHLAYRHQPGDAFSTEIFVVGADGAHPIDVSQNDGRADWGPSWAPDGSVIGWNTQRPGMSSGFVLGLVAPDGSGSRTVEPNVWVEYPAWSPDGRRIAFMSQTPEGTSNYEVYVMNADGSDAVRLTDSPGPDGWPTWSPDGTRIAFASVRDDCSISHAPDCLSTGDIGPYHTLWVMNADGTDQHRVSRRFVQIADWSPDGRYLVFGTQDGLGIVSRDGAAYAQLPLAVGDPSFPDWIE